MALQMLTNGALLFQSGDLRDECCCESESSSFDCDYPVLPVTITGINVGNATGSDGGGYYYLRNGEKWYSGDTLFICPDDYSVRDCTSYTTGTHIVYTGAGEYWRWDGGNAVPEIQLITESAQRVSRKITVTNCANAARAFGNRTFNLAGGYLRYFDGWDWLAPPACASACGQGANLAATLRTTSSISTNSIPSIIMQSRLDNIAGQYTSTDGLTVSWGELIR